ncbi:MAG: hypothetical protein GQ570_11695 [Helicobacteraceae bacterium]|nr:hypothetical protein [Helicobacteraceae bacterium]
MIKNDNGNIEMDGNPKEIVIELMQLTHKIAEAFSKEVGREVTLEELFKGGIKLLKEDEDA